MSEPTLALAWDEYQKAQDEALKEWGKEIAKQVDAEFLAELFKGTWVSPT